MAFAHGSIAFKRFYIQGNAPKAVDDELLDALAGRAFTANPLRSGDHTESGWTTGQHLLDTRFNRAKNAVADGLHFAIRVDTTKPPADLVRSYQQINEETMLEASGREFLNKTERREARAQALAQADKEARAGAFRRSRQTPAFWDLKRNEVVLGGTSPTLADQFMLLFRETFDRPLTPATSGEMAARWSGLSGTTHEYDHARPSYFIKPPAESDSAENDPSRFDVQSRDYLGTEWLMWLWYTSHVESPEVLTGLGQSVPIFFSRALQLECAFKLTGTTTISAEGPTQLPEATVALAGGKRPVRVGLQIDLHGDPVGLTLRGDKMHFTSVTLPPPAEAQDPRVLFEERIDHLRDLIETTNDLYHAFLKKRLSSKWPQTLQAIRTWVAGHRRIEPQPLPALEVAS
jgi:hypothetical protein